jgi:predicted AAA+ superfamily ATPase
MISSMINIVRFFKPPSKASYFLLGPRGVGKSNCITSLYSNAVYIDLLLPYVARTYLTSPEQLQKIVAAHPEDCPVIIDEIQKIPALLDVVHHLMESNNQHQFILLGSSSRKLKRAGVNLLGGRALKRTLHPFMAAELGELFSLEKALQHGLLPLIINAENPIEQLQAYLYLYLREEIQIEGLVRNLEDFARFLEAISFSHASQLNLTNVARECEVKRKTVENYVSILEDLLLAYSIPVFTKHAQRELVAHSKFYLFDAGVYQILRPRGFLDKPEEIGGHALEGLVAQHLRAWNEYSGEPYTISYWRTKAGLEVDFILYGEKDLYAIEVKSAGKVHASDLKSLQAFVKDYPMAKAILLYGGKERLQEKNILCLPVDEFLRQLKPNQNLLFYS